MTLEVWLESGGAGCDQGLGGDCIWGEEDRFQLELCIVESFLGVSELLRGKLHASREHF